MISCVGLGFGIHINLSTQIVYKSAYLRNASDLLFKNKMSSPVVEVKEGKIKGSIKKTPKNLEFFSFKGIPYAKPPIGELRFSIPVHPDTWTGIRDCTKDVNACPQYDAKTNNFIGNEDCLYLNVYTPKQPGSNEALLPVMFYIHGGGFAFGHGTDDTTNGPEYLMEKDIVFVSINYRLGILGFLSLDCKEAPGNMGLRDQVLALKWVKENITQFNGDPNNVTIVGPSAGGASVEYLVLSPAAKGLFHKAIAMCGSTLCHWASYSKVKQLAYKLPAMNKKECKNDQELLKYLKSMDTKELVTSFMQALATEEFRGGVHFGFVPVIEKPGDWEPFMDKNTYELLKTGQFTKVPFMAGFSTREGLLMLGIGQKILNNVVQDKKFANVLPFIFDKSEENMIEEKLQSIYLKSNNVFKDNDAFAIDYFTDILILGGVYTAATLISKCNPNPVYFYEFTYDGNLNAVKNTMKIDRAGACHGDEMGYLLKIPLAAPAPKDILVKERMVTLWTNFAKYGDPTPATDKLITTKWEPMTTDKPACYIISDKLEMKNAIYPERVEMFMKLYEMYPVSNLS